MRRVNHKWQINEHRYWEIETPIGELGNWFHLKRDGKEYRMPNRYIAEYIPLNRYYIEIAKVNEHLERLTQPSLLKG